MDAQEKKNSAAGEQTAIVGYFKQYEYSACEIFRVMNDGTFRGITISEPEAGIFDDLVLHAGEAVVATQVKSQEDVQSVALNTALISNALIKDIAASWARLKARFTDRPVKLRYIFGGYFSQNDTALANTGSNQKKHSAEFARFVAHDDLTVAELKAAPWSAKLEEMRALTGQSEDEFCAFLNALELLDHGELMRNRASNFFNLERQRVEALIQLIPRLIIKRKTGAYFSEADLVRELGWRKVIQRNVHEFPVPDDFQDNDATRDELLQKISQQSRGYISLVGPPGTGKSTLLQTALFNTSEYGVARYLAFVPNQRHGLGRAEAGEFLNDLIAELMSLDLGGSRYALDDLAGQRKELAHQLETASERYAKTGRKTIIVIDGLDHVPREEDPRESFLKQLPLAHAVPDGVLFVLGTQTLDLADLKASIVQQAKGADRRVEITPLPPAAIFAMANDAGLPDYVDRDGLLAASEGHPLTARYFVEALKPVTSASEAQHILSATDGLGRSLDEIYARVWIGLSADESAKAALGLLARADGGLTPAQIAGVYSNATVEEVLKKAGFLLSGVGQERLSIFHNSFRLFVVAQTGVRFGKREPALEVEFNQRLAGIAAAADESDAQHWMELRYRARAGETDPVLALATPEYFRRSLMLFRPRSEIDVDLRLTYAAVKPTRSRVILLNKLLIEKEVEYRREAVSQLDMVGLFLDLGDVDLAIHHALEANTPGEGWLRLVDVLWEDGHAAIARRVLDANEPLEALFGVDKFHSGSGINTAGDWIERAQRFRPIERLVSIIERIPANDYEDVDLMRQGLLYRVARGIVKDKPDADIATLCIQLKLRDEYQHYLYITAADAARAANDLDRAKQLLGSIAALRDFSTLDAHWKTYGARVARQLGDDDLAKRLMQDIEIPSIGAEESGSQGDALSEFASKIYERTALSTILLTPARYSARGRDNPFFNGLDDKVIELGRIRGAIETKADDGDILALKTVIRYFANAKPDRGDFSAYKFHGLIPVIGERIARITRRLHGAQFADIVGLVDELIAAGGTNFHGSETFRLVWASNVYQINGDAPGAQARIEGVETLARSDRTPHEVVEFRASLAKAYAEIGLDDKAKASLDAMHIDTFGYWLRAKKEPQYEFWLWSYLKACDADPTNAGERAITFSQFVLGMDETEGDDTARRLVGDLLAGAATSPAVMGGVARRLMASDLTSWAEIVDGVLAAVAAQRSDLAVLALDVFAQLVVPYVTARNDRAVAACLAAMPSGDRAAAIDRLVEQASIYCPPSERLALFEQISSAAPDLAARFANAQAAAVADRDMLQRKSEDKSAEKGVSVEESDATTLSELLAEGDGTSKYGDGIDYFYARTAERLAGGATKAEIETFITQRPRLVQDAKFMAACARAVLNAGDTAAARAFFAKAEKAAQSGHWSSFMGGQKLELQSLRITLDGDQGREKGFDVLIDELSSGQTYGSSLFLNLDDVLESVSVDHPYVEWWAETETHLRQYREFRLAPPVEADASVQNHGDIIAWLIAEAYSLHCPDVLDHARAAMLTIAPLPGGASVLQTVFKLLHDQPDGSREAIALAYRLRREATLKDALLIEARRGVEHADFVVSNLAQRALKHFQVAHPAAPPGKLPTFYDLAPSGTPEAEKFDLPPGVMSGARPMWSDDPWTQTTMLRFAFRVLADHTEVPMETLRRRCAEFLRRLGGREKFGPEAETWVQGKLRRLHLMLTWRKLQPMAAQRAFGMVLKELADADAVDPRVFELLWDEIGGPSLRDFDLRFQARPDWAHRPATTSREYGGLDADAWLAAAEEDLYASVVTEGFVLAERRYYKLRVWRENAESTRLTLPNVFDIEDTSIDLDDVPRLHTLDNLQPLYDSQESKLICRIFQPYFGDLRETAITICPYLASKLGWIRSKAKPFELHDASGAIVATTMRWIDGTDQVDTYESEIFEEGQAIVLSIDGRAQVEAFVGPLLINTKTTRRTAREGSGTNSRSLFSATPEPLIIAAE
ncbi:AAA ATPase-like protein [Methylosinus sp. sav-2]|uniref:ATP-binding protein n=3 Tax=unclassified Methylosinus TaxID=2624500 RepID=UPI00047921E8|nr:ATP-binding protein [Methylosinus sp. sav-2]TDX61127.1 AAA ATPase-like protein [Methylosinus sp. sav-2]